MDSSCSGKCCLMLVFLTNSNFFHDNVFQEVQISNSSEFFHLLEKNFIIENHDFLSKFKLK